MEAAVKSSSGRLGDSAIGHNPRVIGSSGVAKMRRSGSVSRARIHRPPDTNAASAHLGVTARPQQRLELLVDVRQHLPVLADRLGQQSEVPVDRSL